MSFEPMVSNAQVEAPNLESAGCEVLLEREAVRVEAEDARVHLVSRHDEHGASACRAGGRHPSKGQAPPGAVVDEMEVAPHASTANLRYRPSGHAGSVG